ncbi:MAG TPA: FHA domain-containing protein [Tepidisphaeraceae bacterium]|nr:FHA domain-containing protein [Tepidisphaeraceae bacterium]
MRDMTVIGRREDCDLRIPLSDVSRKHCRLVRDGDTLRLEDLGSSNGTYRNGERVQEAILSPGDTLQVGPVQFVLQIDGNPADDELAPAYASDSQVDQSYVATEESTIGLQAEGQYDVPEHAETISAGEDVSGARELSENATIDEAPPIAAPTAPRAAVAAASAKKKSNGVHAAPPPPPPPVPPAPMADESESAPPFQGLDELEGQSGEQDFFILDEPSSSSQSGEIQIDIDSPPA